MGIILYSYEEFFNYFVKNWRFFVWRFFKCLIYGYNSYSIGLPGIQSCFLLLLQSLSCFSLIFGEDYKAFNCGFFNIFLECNQTYYNHRFNHIRPIIIDLLKIF